MERINQQHEPSVFLGEEFSRAQFNFTTYEKEAYGIVKIFEKLDLVL